jgi:integrase
MLLQSSHSMLSHRSLQLPDNSGVIICASATRFPQSGLVQCLLFRPRNSRHTTATHLLRAGVDINTIRAWLGHVSLDTTNIYAEIDLEMKAKALAKCEITNAHNSNRHWRDDPTLMTFLRGL